MDYRDPEEIESKTMSGLVAGETTPLLLIVRHRRWKVSLTGRHDRRQKCAFRRSVLQASNIQEILRRNQLRRRALVVFCPLDMQGLVPAKSVGDNLVCSKLQLQLQLQGCLAYRLHRSQ